MNWERKLIAEPCIFEQDWTAGLWDNIGHDDNTAPFRESTGRMRKWNDDPNRLKSSRIRKEGRR